MTAKQRRLHVADSLGLTLQMKLTYENQLKTLQQKLSSLEAEARRREREMADQQLRVDKIEALQKSLEEAKIQAASFVPFLFHHRSDAN